MCTAAAGQTLVDVLSLPTQKALNQKRVFVTCGLVCAFEEIKAEGASRAVCARILTWNQDFHTQVTFGSGIRKINMKDLSMHVGRSVQM
jgi:hypothetical protein